MRLSFLGAAGTVTGSKTLVESGSTRILVDCGLFQGFKALRERNWDRLPLDPHDLDAVVVTHAHIDHSGYLPRLVKEGYRGPVYTTDATRDLLGLLLPDSGHLQEEDARYANKRGFSKHSPALPLYTEDQARASLAQVRAVPWEQPLTLGELTITFRPAGHILGASMVRVDGPDGSVLFSGDLGRPRDPIMPPPAAVTDVPDLLVLESTYGNRHHGEQDPMEALAEIIQRTIARRGMVVVPAFAVGRAQAVLYGVHLLKQQGRLPADLPVFLNSPMAVDTTELYLRHADLHRLSEPETRAMCRSAEFVRTAQESKQLNQRQGPGVIISASGMVTGGRILHHVKAFGPDSRNTLLFVGFQAGGTRGARIVAGERTVRIHGQEVPIRCEVARIDAWSAHADQEETLEWLSAWPGKPARVVLNHGEPDASDALRQRMQQLGWSVTVAELGGQVELELDDDSVSIKLQRPTSPAPAGRATPAKAPARPPVAAVDDTVVDAALVSIGARAAAVVVGHSDSTWGARMRGLPEAIHALGTPVDALVVPVGAVADSLGPEAHAHHLAFVPVPAELLSAPHLPARTRALIAFPGGYDTLTVVCAALDRSVRGLGPDVPVILVDRSFWREALGSELLRERGHVPSDSGGLVIHVDTVEQALEAIEAREPG